MEKTWDNDDRINAVHAALHRLPHDQTAVKMGFHLQHNPTTCTRCKAYIAILELASVISYLEEQVETREPVDV